MASTRRTSQASAWLRRSVDVSTRIDRTDRTNSDPVPSSTSMRIEGRVRRSRGSVDVHTAQSQPIEGTPLDVPLPRTVTRMGSNPRQNPGSRRDDPLLAGRALHESHAKLV